MRYSGDDYDFEDDGDEIYDDDAIDVDDENEDDDEESSRPQSRVNPFTNRPASNLPGSSSAGRSSFSGSGSSGPSSASRLPGSVGANRPGTSSPGGSGASSPPRYGASSSPGGGSSSGARPGTPGGSSGPGGSSQSGSRFGSPSGSSSGGSGSTFSGSSSGSRPGAPGSSGPGGSSQSGSRFGSPGSGSSGGSGSSFSGSSSGARPGTPGSSGSGGSSQSGSRFGGGGSSPSTTKPDDKKPSGGGVLGGLSSRLGGGGDKPAAPKSSGGGLGGLTSRLPLGNRDKSASPSRPGGGQKSGGGLGGLTSRLPFGKKDDKPGSGARPGMGSSPSSSTGARPGAAPSGGESRSFLNRGGSAAARPATTRSGAKSEGGLSRFLPFLGQKGEKKPAAAKPRTSKAPKVQGEGLSLDSKLDILGVGLVLGSLALFFSSLSPNKGQLTEAINNWLGQVFGWGAVAIPVAMLAVGIWLIARHFGEEAPVVPTLRVIGIVMVYIGALLVLQFIDTFNYVGDRQVLTLSDLKNQIQVSWELFRSGGGYVGGQLYYLLVENLGEVGAFFIIAGWLIVGIMFTLSISAAELAMIIISVGRSFNDARRQRAARRAAAVAALQAEQMAAIATAPSVSIAKPEVEALPGGTVPALPAAAESAPALPERNIAINIGGRSLPTPGAAEPVPVERRPGAQGATSPLQPARAEATSGGGVGSALGARLRGALPGGKAGDKAPAAEKAAETAKPSSAGIRDRLFGRGAKQETSAPATAAASPGTSTEVVRTGRGEVSVSPAVASAAPAAVPSAPKTPTLDTPPAAEPARLSDLMRPASGSDSGLKPTAPPPVRPAYGSGTSAPGGAGKSVFGGAVSSGSAASGTTDRPAAPSGARPFGAAEPSKASILNRPTRPILDDDESDDSEELIAKPAASVAPPAPPKAPEKTAEELEAERLASLPPARPRGTGPLPRADENKSRFGATTFGSKPAAATTPTSPAERQDRLNAIRSGNLAEVKPEDALEKDDKAEKRTQPAASPFGHGDKTAGAKPAARMPSALDDEDIDEFDLDDEEVEDEAIAPAAKPATVSPFSSLNKTGDKAPASPSAPRPFSPAASSGDGKPATPRPEGEGTGVRATPADKTPQPTAAFWKSPAENAAATGLPVSATAAKPPASSFGKPTQPPGVPEPPRPAAASTEPVINTPRPAEPPPPSAGVGRNAPAGVKRRKEWKLPNTSNLLMPGSDQEFDRESLLKRARLIEDTLNSFGAPGKVVEVNTGPVITQFGVEPDYLVARGGKKNRVKVGAIAQLDKDLQLALGAKSIRIEAPVPGKGYVGIEVPNEEASLVSLRDVMESDEFKRIDSPLTIALGQSVDGTPVAADLSVMPHLLIAGTTGSGKSVCVNAIITSLLIRNTPDVVKFIMVDPKRVELTGYNGIPHLVAPVVVELERIVGVLKWVTREMDERYKRFSNAGARNIEDFNKHLREGDERMPYIIVIIDELADLMMLAPDETERVITRIAALARATGIHLVIATQRPSVDVVTGLIKANFPARIAFAVAGGVDSRVILDQPGAEKLLGRGDMLYMSGDSPAALRLQGVFVSDTEINNINRYWRAQVADDEVASRPISQLVLDNTVAEPARSVTAGSERSQIQQAFWERDNGPSSSVTSLPGSANGDDDPGGGQDDELYEEAVELVRRLNKASVSLLQRRLRIGYTRAARLIDVMEEQGIVGPATEGSKPREVLPLD